MPKPMINQALTPKPRRSARERAARRRSPGALRAVSLCAAMMLFVGLVAGHAAFAVSIVLRDDDRTGSVLYPPVSPGAATSDADDADGVVRYGGRLRDVLKAWSLPPNDVPAESMLQRLRRPLDGDDAASAGERALIEAIIAGASMEAVVEADDEHDASDQRRNPQLERQREAVRMLASLGRWQVIEPRFGLRPRSADDVDAQAAVQRGGGRAVVLVHGLDDPGWMWDELAPELEAAGYVVLEFLYPNDGPVVESADLLALVLAQLHPVGDIHLDIVAHSMGGLVVRDLLSRPLLEGARGEVLPHVDRFIMCGTPNHGSALAPMRLVTDLRERAVRTARGQDPRIGSLEEGRGLAAVDLAPGSEFLRALNRRTLPPDITATIIAGRLVADPDAAIRDAADRARKSLNEGGAPAWTVTLVRRFGTVVRRAASETLAAVGDGLVSLESAQLEEVTDFNIIEANHASMLISRFGGPVPPPAIPIILDRLAREP